MAAMRAEGGNDFVGRKGIIIGPYHQAFAELFYFLTTADYLGGCVRNNLKYISFEDCSSWSWKCKFGQRSTNVESLNN